MDSTSVQSYGASAGILRAADQNVEVAAKLLKKVNDSDKLLVNTLLPLPNSGGLDVHA